MALVLLIWMGGGQTTIDPIETSVPQFQMFVSPFSNTFKKKIKDACENDNYGLRISSDRVNNRAFMFDIVKESIRFITT